MEIILTATLLIALAAIAILSYFLISSRRHSLDRDELDRHNRDQLRNYEESTRRLLDETRRSYQHQIDLLEERLERQTIEARRQSASEFSLLAAKVLEQNSERLRAENNDNIGAILNPLREKIDDFRQAVTDSYVKENSSREALNRQISTLAQSNSEISREARHLSDALKGNSAIQGRWGETVLEQILERAGFIKGIHFQTQVAKDAGMSLRDDDGRSQRPDVILNLPGDHKLIIDAKTSISSYLRYCDAPSDDIARAELKRHAASTKKHVDELAAKQYHKYVTSAMEHTLMFMPNDAAYLAALRGDPELCDYAVSKNVVIVSPAHLLSVVQLIAQLWRVEKQNRNAEEIARLGGQLYDKFVSFIADFESIDRAIKSSERAYEKCRSHLSRGNASLVSRSEKLRQMGAKVTKRIPEHLASTSELSNLFTQEDSDQSTAVTDDPAADYSSAG